MWSSNRTLRACPAKDGTNRLSTGILYNKEHGGEYDTEQESNHEVETKREGMFSINKVNAGFEGLHCHPDGDCPNSDILHPVDTMPSVPNSLNVLMSVDVLVCSSGATQHTSFTKSMPSTKIKAPTTITADDARC